MKVAKLLFVSVIGLFVCSGCVTYRTSYGKDSGVIKVGGFIWPAPQTEVVVINGTTHLVELKEGANTEKTGLAPMEAFTFAYNVYNTQGMDLPLIAIVYEVVGGKKVPLGMVTQTFHLYNSSGRYDRFQWIIRSRDSRDEYYGQTN